MGEDVLIGISSLLEEWMERKKNLTISQLPAVGGAPLSHPWGSLVRAETCF